MLSVIIVNYKNPELLRLCLKSIIRSENKYSEYEIVVVDVSASTETRNVATEEFGNSGPKIKYVPFSENIGYTKGVNEGIKAAEGDMFFLINADIVPLENSVSKLANFLKSDPTIGLIGPKLLNFDGSRQESCFRFYTPMIIVYRRTFLGRLPWAKRALEKFTMKDCDTSKMINVDWLMGSALMLSRAAFAKVGPMDENLFLYMSEVDWAKRFWENGYRVVYYPDSEMYHYHRRESKGSLNFLDAIFHRLTQRHIIDALKFFSKHGFFRK